MKRELVIDICSKDQSDEAHEHEGRPAERPGGPGPNAEAFAVRS